MLQKCSLHFQKLVQKTWFPATSRAKHRYNRYLVWGSPREDLHSALIDHECPCCLIYCHQGECLGVLVALWLCADHIDKGRSFVLWNSAWPAPACLWMADDAMGGRLVISSVLQMVRGWEGIVFLLRVLEYFLERLDFVGPLRTDCVPLCWVWFLHFYFYSFNYFSSVLTII